MKYLKVLNILNKLFAIPFALFAAAWLYFGIAATRTGSMVAVLLTVLVALGFSAAAWFFWVLGSRVRQGRWKVAQIVVAAIMIPNFPLGTAYAVFALFTCLKGASDCFDRDASEWEYADL